MRYQGVHAGRQAGGRTHQRRHAGQRVDHRVHHGPPLGGCVVVPVAAWRPGEGEFSLDTGDAPEIGLVGVLQRLQQGRRVHKRKCHAGQATGSHRRLEGDGIVPLGRQRLFHQHVLASIRRVGPLRGVQGVRRRDHDRINFTIGKQLPVIGVPAGTVAFSCLGTRTRLGPCTRRHEANIPAKCIEGLCLVEEPGADLATTNHSQSQRPLA